MKHNRLSNLVLLAFEYKRTENFTKITHEALMKMKIVYQILYIIIIII